MAQPIPYEEKFKNFLEMIDQAKKRGGITILLHNPQALGDTYEELVESLNRLADAELPLRILPRSERGNAAPS